MPKHKKENPVSNQKHDTPMGPDALQHLPASVDPDTRAQTGGTQVQNLNQNYITETGNDIKNNTPAGNFDEVRHSAKNKPRHAPNPTRFDAK